MGEPYRGRLKKKELGTTPDTMGRDLANVILSQRSQTQELILCESICMENPE